MRVEELMGKGGVILVAGQYSSLPRCFWTSSSGGHARTFFSVAVGGSKGKVRWSERGYL